MGHYCGFSLPHGSSISDWPCLGSCWLTAAGARPCPGCSAVCLCSDAIIRENPSALQPQSSAAIPRKATNVLDSMDPEGSWPQATFCPQSALPFRFLDSGLYSYHLLTSFPSLSNELSFRTFHIFPSNKYSQSHPTPSFLQEEVRSWLLSCPRYKALGSLSIMVYPFPSDQQYVPGAL